MEEQAKPVEATYDDVAEFAAELPDEYLRCRGFGHDWLEYTASEDKKHHVLDEAFKCRYCESMLYRVLSQRGTQLERHIDYSEGYLMAGKGRMSSESRDAIRREGSLRRVKRLNQSKSKQRKLKAVN